MRYVYRLAIVLLPVLLVGCPLTGKYPLGDSRSAPMDDRYIGRWVVTMADHGDNERMLILPFNENEYYVEIRVDNDNVLSRHRAYLTSIDNVHILNLQDLDNSVAKRNYSFIKISFAADDIISLRIVKDNLLKMKNPSGEDLKRYIRDNIDNEEIYGKAISLKRQVQ